MNFHWPPAFCIPFVLSPQLEALPMSGSTFNVAMNALMLNLTKLAGLRKSIIAVEPQVAWRAGHT